MRQYHTFDEFLELTQENILAVIDKYRDNIDDESIYGMQIYSLIHNYGFKPKYFWEGISTDEFVDELQLNIDEYALDAAFYILKNSSFGMKMFCHAHNEPCTRCRMIYRNAVKCPQFRVQTAFVEGAPGVI